ncbi:hypothetical protein ACWGH8_41500 [Nonomuraea muscovyensis]|uniref:Putative membrane protein YfhO n=1 Tax=Nonomuraea muscovyensis TaxID=1124761 RepID=A0A7X0F2F4_9ACTN|nr:hypothetical protein [Nonomuraea muscovyensis]MBB6350181.1 putative membrane protein YfhO [Nonomuraea muscovyensis]
MLVIAVFLWNVLVFPFFLLAIPPHLVALMFLGMWPPGWLFPVWVLILLLVVQVIAARWIGRNKGVTDRRQLARGIRIALWGSMALVAAQGIMDLLI